MIEGTDWVYLKVKIKSLAEEARIICKMERKYRSFRHGLKEHRHGIVRDEQRHTLLAYGFLRGVPYAKVERSTMPVNKDKVKKMVMKYGAPNVIYNEVTGERLTIFAGFRQVELLKELEIWFKE